jgi:hypothetical protein
MKRTYAPHEERKGLIPGQGRDAPQESLAAEQPLPERAAGVPLNQLPAVPAARSLRQTAVRQMQQAHGNAHVQRELTSEISRQEDDEIQAPVEAQAPAPTAQAPTAETEAPGPATQAPTPGLEAPAPEAQVPSTEAGGPTAETETPTVEAEAPTPGTEAPATEAGQAQTTISGDGSTVSTDAGGVTIDGARLSVNAAAVNINSPMVTTSGVLRTDTLIADSVVGSSYTPGAGNVW